MDEDEVFLTDEQVRRLTGWAHKARQVEQLRKMGVPFYVNGRGVPIVARAVVEGTARRAPPKKEVWVPRVFREAEERLAAEKLKKR